jgi:hypothetical protein
LKLLIGISEKFILIYKNIMIITIVIAGVIANGMFEGTEIGMPHGEK